MQISCPSCSAQYNVDEARIPPQGVSIKCPRCQHQFVVPAPDASGAVPLPSASSAVPLPGASSAVPLPGASSGAVPLPGAGASPVPLPGMSAPPPRLSSVPLPSPAAGAVPLPGMGAVPLPGMGAVSLPGMGAVPLPGMGAVPLPGMGAVPLPGMGAVPLPGMGAVPLPGGAVPLPGMGGVPLPGGAVPLPGLGAVPLPGMGVALPSMNDFFDDEPVAASPAPPPGSANKAASMADIFGDLDNDAPLPTPFHGNNSVVVNTSQGMNNLLDFIDDAGKAELVPKYEQYRIRKRSGRVLGPFDVPTVLQMFARGELLGSEEASTDNVSWRSLAQIPAFSDTIQKAMASALGGLEDLPVPKGSEKNKKPVISDDFAVGTGDLLNAEKAKEEVERRRRDAAEGGGSRKVMIGVAAASVVVVIGVVGVALNFASPYGWFGYKYFAPDAVVVPVGPVAVVEAPPPPPTFAGEVAGDELLLRDTYIAYAQGAEQAKRIVDANKNTSPFPEVGRKAAAQQGRFLAYLVIVEGMPAFAADLSGALALAGGDDLAVAIGKAAEAYAAGKWDDGLAAIKPLTDPARSLPPSQLAEAEVWIALGARGKGDSAEAMKHADMALQSNVNSVLALSLQAQLLAAAGDPEGARGYLDKVFALNPTHPRSKIQLGNLLSSASESVEEGKAILVELSEGEASKAASPAQRADAYFGRAEIAISARAYPDAMRLLSAGLALVPTNRAFRIRAVDFAIRLRDYTVAREHAKALLEMAPEDPAGVIGMARAKLGTKDTLGAYSDLQLALKKHPDDAALNFWFGVAAKEMGKVAEARTQFEKAQKLDPHSASPVVENVLDAIAHGKLSDALKIADGALELVNAGERHRVRAVKAYVYARRRQFVEADAEYTRALNENPRDTDARAHYAEALIEMKRVAEAEKQVNEAMLMDGKNPAVLLASGDVAKARGELKLALDRYEEAMQLAPNAFEPYARAAVVAAQLKDPQRARGLAETAGQLRPGNPDVVAAQALVMAVQNPKQAATLLTQASESAPEDPRYPFLLGTVHHSMGATLEAIDDLKKATTLAPNYDNAWFLFGKVNRELGRSEDARRAFAQVTEIDNTRADAWVETADILATSGDDAGALVAYEKALQAEPTNPLSVCAMGETLVVRMGEDDKNLKRGTEMLERCTKLNPMHPTAWRQLGEVYRGKNKKKEAINAYKTHLRFNPNDPEANILSDYIVDLGGKP